MNYLEKIQASIRRIQVAAHIAERHGEPLIVCFSGGKDSHKRAEYPVITHHLHKREKVLFYPIIDWL